MNIHELIKKLESKPNKNEDVQFVVWNARGDLICVEMSGAATQDLMRVFAKHAPKQPTP